MKEISTNKQLVINMSASFVSYGVSLFISFFLSPYIVRTVGVEANGFVGLANNFVSYAGIITIALNSLAGRFITVSLTQGKVEEANRYFSSVFYANLFLAAVLAAVGGIIIFYLDRLIHVPREILGDIRWLFFFVFLNCVLGVLGSVFGVAAFARNKLYLSSLREIEGTLARALCIVALFALTRPRVCYLGAASVVSGGYILIRNIGYTKELLPEIRISRKHFDLARVRELVGSGIWNTINRLGQILIDGLDLLITNLFVDVTAMGILGLAKTVPNLISGLMGSIVGVFSPNYTILYAQGRSRDLLAQIKRSMKIIGVITNIPIVILIVCGRDFFANWQPTVDARTLQALSLLTIGCLIISGGINCLYGIFTVVNRMKANSLAVLLGGLISTVLVFILVHVTDLGVYAVAGTSTVISILRNLIFTAPYGAKCLGQKWYVFYPDIFKQAGYVAVCTAAGYGLMPWIGLSGWPGFFVKAFIVGTVCLLIGVLFILNQTERRILVSKLLRRS